MLSFPRKRESRDFKKFRGRLDTRFRGYDEFLQDNPDSMPDMAEDYDTAGSLQEKGEK
jgi:hypothetical protein